MKQEAYDIAFPDLAEAGRRKIAWADQQMPVLQQIRREFTAHQPLSGLRLAASLHVTAETANLLRTLQAGGAEVMLCASDPLSTQDDIAASLVHDFEIPVFARRAESASAHYRQAQRVLDSHPQLTLDDGATLIGELHKKRKHQLSELIGGTEETTTGTTRLQSMARHGSLQYPVIAVNEARTTRLSDHRYGTGQSTLDGLVRATNILLAGKHLVLCGYGWSGKGIALRAKGMGAVVIIVEVNPVQALEAALDGFFVTNMAYAAELGEIFITATGDLNVIRDEHFKVMKDGAILCNAGHFNSEIEIPALEEMATHKEEMRPGVMAYHAPDKTLYLLAEGRLINLTAAEGHPAAVMDMSFANQALSLEYLVKHQRDLGPRVYPVPPEIDGRVAILKLQAMGIKIDQPRIAIDL